MEQDELIGLYKQIGVYPRTKTQVKQFERYKSKLKISSPQTEYILLCILSADWGRRVIISSIEEIYITKSLDMVGFKFSLAAPRVSISYCTSNILKDNGWSTDILNKSIMARMWSVWHNMNYYMRS